MATDHIRYDVLAQAALRGVVRTVLADVAKKGLPGEHHFKITFSTVAPGVRLSDRMRAQYPETMTIILQHQFWDLHVDDAAFEVGLSFGGVPERLAVPFEAVTAFYDPAVQFGFQFETLDANAPVIATGSQAAVRAYISGWFSRSHMTRPMPQVGSTGWPTMRSSRSAPSVLARRVT